jgi:hypothetical protein
MPVIIQKFLRLYKGNPRFAYNTTARRIETLRCASYGGRTAFDLSESGFLLWRQTLERRDRGLAQSPSGAVKIQESCEIVGFHPRERDLTDLLYQVEC